MDQAAAIQNVLKAAHFAAESHSGQRRKGFHPGDLVRLRYCRDAPGDRRWLVGGGKVGHVQRHGVRTGR